MVARLHKRSLLLGVLVPLGLLAGQASSIVHSMVVEHQRCREHGELVHRVLAPGGSLGAEAQPSRNDTRHPRLLAAALAEGHGHDHCLSASDRRDGLRPPERPVASVAAPPSAPLALAGAPAPLVSGTLILVAPKTSPPPIDG
jgi:hypothetical protein